MSDVTDPKVPPAYDGYKKLVCPFLPCERVSVPGTGTMQLAPTMCLGPACACYMRMLNEEGREINGDCSVRMTAGQVGNLVQLLAMREQQRGTPPIIRPV